METLYGQIVNDIMEKLNRTPGRLDMSYRPKAIFKSSMV